jgi:hypothetical protein
VNPAPTFNNVKPFVVAWCICLLVLELLGAKLVSGRSPLDFQEFYAAGYQVRVDPSQLYNQAQQDTIQRALTSRAGSLTFYHPSYQTLIFVPFSLLSFRSAYLAFIAFNMVLLMAAFFAARPAFSSVIPMFQPRPGLIFFAFVPLLATVVLGQDSIMSLLLCCLMWRQLQSGKDVSAGFFLALALFKFQFIIPIAILIAIRRGWRFSLGFLITSAGVVLLCFAVGGRAGMRAYVHLLLVAGSAVGKSALEQHRLTLSPRSMPNLAGLLYGCGARVVHSLIAFEALIGACALALFAWCAHAVRRLDQTAAFSIAILCGLLVSYHLYEYELTLVLLPIALLANRVHRYILMSLFILPLVLLGLGASWIFLMAIPVLAMLVNAIVSSREPVTSEPQTAVASA